MGIQTPLPVIASRWAINLYIVRWDALPSIAAFADRFEMNCGSTYAYVT
jgi:hypothetical protein